VKHLKTGLILVDNHRSLATERIMQLLNVKCNAFMLYGEGKSAETQALVDKLSTDFKSIFEDIALAEEEEVAIAASRRSDQEPTGAADLGELDAAEGVHGGVFEEDEPLDLFELD
jgi:hypothetical protein